MAHALLRAASLLLGTLGENCFLDKYLAVLAGAGLGGLARFVASTWIMEKYAGKFPLGTFIINITGSFLIGVLMMLFTERWQLQHNWRLFLVVGVLGGYTTFSSFEYETYQAVRDGEGTPRYVVVGSGPDHDRVYVAEVFLGGTRWGSGEGRSKKDAEQEAARAAWEGLTNA